MIKEVLQDLGIKDPEKYLEEFIEDKLLKSNNLQQAFNISCEQMERYYRDAYTFYSKEHYLEASDAFRALVILDPFTKKYWMGLAGALQMLERYDKALRAYAMVTLLDQEDPYPHFYAHQCLKMLKEDKEAELAFALANKLAAVKNIRFK